MNASPQAAPTYANAHPFRQLSGPEQCVAIERALTESGGHTRKAAQRLDMTRMQLWRFLSELGMLHLPKQVSDRAKRRFRLVG